MKTAEERAAVRRVVGLMLYRGALSLTFLVAAFEAFPEHKAVTALAFLVFAQGIAAIGLSQGIIAANQNRLDDLAERKTRHAILMSREHWASEPEFWAECNRRVAGEFAEQPPASSWWVQACLVAVNVAGRLTADAFSVGFAAVLAGSTGA